MDFLGDVIVSLLGSLGSLGVAWVIYKSTRSDEATRTEKLLQDEHARLEQTLSDEHDRLERTFAAEREARMEERSRDRRVALARGLDDTLRRAARILIEIARGLEHRDRNELMKYVAELPNLSDRLNDIQMLLVKYHDLHQDLRQVNTIIISLSEHIETWINIAREPMESWYANAVEMLDYSLNFTLTVRSRIEVWEDSAAYRPLHTSGELPTVFLPTPDFSSLGD